jgi:hypothetical protein
LRNAVVGQGVAYKDNTETYYEHVISLLVGSWEWLHELVVSVNCNYATDEPKNWATGHVIPILSFLVRE